ncbi:MAG: anaerobic ribonucleoside-triphosphate reductase activating protein [Erysipelotrichaceae bacterium]|jgi:anaerobic ribonucleoside-triphosphate reductase activating protein|nr:anaerobic ribonucleoside-triphosphate reductase activating protein [Erysipelotrichaceae bacterium]
MDNMIRLASALQQDSIVDGPGMRCVLWTQGCPHHCPGCHNPQTHALDGGMTVSVDEIIAQMKNMKLQSGITFSGGEPFLQAKALVHVAKAAKQLHWTLWAYSGFTFEEIQAHEDMREFLSYLDILVDGKFREEEKDYRLRFKGSRNQRIIDVPSSLAQHKIILSAYDDGNQNLD